MKTDTVLTMDEYFAECCIATKHVTSPTDNGRHIPVTNEGDIDPRSEEHGCTCDRWGHPACLEERKPRLCPAADELVL
jgi:hypothetical protein